MKELTVILFFIYMYGFGYSLLRFVKNIENPLERHVIRLGVGLAVFVVTSLLLNVLHIPLNWYFMLILSLIIPAYDVIKSFAKNKKVSLPELPKPTLTLLLLILIFAGTFFMYHKGANAYPYLEDSDPWDHAKTASYIADQKTAYEPDLEKRDFFQYTDAYPPAYPILMGMLLQTSGDVFWTLKFFNALLLSLGLLFFYFFTYRFFNSKNKALIATILLALIPAYMSHFIWALTLSVLFYFVAFYAIEMIKTDKKWWVIVGIVIGAMMLTQTTTTFKFGIFFGAYWLVKSFIEKKLHLSFIYSGVTAVLIAGILWWIPMLVKWGYPEIIEKGLYQGTTANVLTPKAFAYYSISDFFSAPHTNMINNPIGFGFFLFTLFILTLVFILINFSSYRKKTQMPILVSWAFLSFLMIQASHLPVRMDPHRSWMLFAIFVAMIVSEGIVVIVSLLKKISIPKVVSIVVILLIVAVTSGQARYSINTMAWSNGGRLSDSEIQGFMWMRDNIPLETPCFIFGNFENMISYGFYSCEWCDEVFEFRKTLINTTSDELHDFLKSQEYEYLIMDASSMRKYRGNFETDEAVSKFFNDKVLEYHESELFTVVHQTKGMVIFAVQ